MQRRSIGERKKIGGRRVLKIIGAVIVIAASAGAGYLMCEGMRERLRAVCALSGFVELVSLNIELYKTPLDEIYALVSDRYLQKCSFTERLDSGVYNAALLSGLLRGEEEKEIIRAFGDRIGSGNAEDMVRLCTYTDKRLKSIEEKLRRELPDKQRVYRTISFLAGVSAVIMLI